MNQQHKQEDPKDVRVGLTTRIWIFATLMLAISMPGFSAPTTVANVGHIIIDLAILAAAGFSTAAVWGAFDGRMRGLLPPPSGDTSDIRRLEERLSNLEMINAYERLMQSEKEKADAPHGNPTEQAEPERKIRLTLR